MKKIILLGIIALLIFADYAYAQEDPLQTMASEADTIRVDTLLVQHYNKMVRYAVYNQPDKADSFIGIALETAQKADYPKGESITLIYKGIYLNNQARYKEAEEVHKKGYELAKEAGFDAGCSEHLYCIGILHDNQGEFETALQFYDSAYHYSWSRNDSLSASRYMVSIGNIHIRRGLYSRALESYQDAQSIMEDIGYDHGVAVCISNIGNIYLDQKEYDKALKYYNDGIALYKKMEDLHGETVSLNNTGAVYDAMGKAEKSLEIYRNVLKNYKLLGDQRGISHTKANIGASFSELGDYDSAFYYLNEALEMQKVFQDKEALLLIYNKLGHTYKKGGQYKQAINYTENSLDLALELESLSRTKEAYENLSESWELAGNYQEALKYHKLYKTIHDSIYNEENRKKLVQKELEFEFEKKEKIMELEQKRKDDLHTAEQRRRLILLISTGGALILAIIIGVLILKTSRQRKRTNIKLSEKNEEIKQQRDEIMTQNEEIVRQRDELQLTYNLIRSGITYAARIQSAALPSPEIPDKLFDNFIFYKPREEVSGDFYWFKQIDNKLIVTAADCTGHGIPGAFVSMLGISLLNETVIPANISDPAVLLSELRKKMKLSLNQADVKTRQKDGIDMAVAIIDTQKHCLQFAGANNPIYILRNKELIEYKGTKSPIGIYRRERKFESQIIELKKNDMVYLFSDGYADQFGGKHNQKLTLRRFKALITEISVHPPAEQKRMLSEHFSEWKGLQKQIDDVLVLGIRI